MNQNQLEQARRTRWRQDGNPLLTLDDAERWLADTPLCLYLPRPAHLPVPAPSFVEAIAGRPDTTPGPEAIAAAAQMLARLVASGAVIALNLFGAAPGIGVHSFVGEHPDFLATPEALPYLYALQPERNPKRAPSTVGSARVSPLAAEAYKLLEREGALTTIELRSHLGREVTEAAVLRSLAELWHTMRVVPVPAENPEEGAHWELLSARHRRELNIGSTQQQTTALSILASFYLQSAIAATAEQVELFLSPVASRSRIRDVVHGLSTTRQLASFSLNGDEQFYVEGTLPEIAEEEPAIAAAVGEDAGLEQNEPSMIEAAAAGPVSASPRTEQPSAPRRPSRPAFGERARGSFAARNSRPPSSGRPPRREGGFRRPQRSDSRGSDRGSFRPRAEGEGGTGTEGTSRPSRPNVERRARPSFGRGARPNPGRGFDRPDRSSGTGRPARFDRGGGAAASRGGFDKNSGGFDKRRGFDKGRPARPAGGGFRPEKSFGKPFPRKPFAGRPSPSGEGAERPRFRSAAGAGSSRFAQGTNEGERPPRSFAGGKARSGGRPFGKPQGDRAAGGPRRFGDRSGGPGRTGGFSRPPRRDGESRPAFRDGQSRPAFRDSESRPQQGRPFKRPYAPAGDRPPRRGPAGSYGKSGGDRPPRKFTPRPPSDAGNPASRPEGSQREARPFRAAGPRPGGFRKPGFSKPGFSKPGGKPGGYRKPAGERPVGARPDRPRSPRPAFGSGERPPRSSAGRDAASGPRKPGGFRKSAGPGKSFGKPRPAGAGKGRTSTTTSSGQPRRPGGFGIARSGASGRPPAKGSFGDFKPRGKPSGGKRPNAKRPGGLGAPKRKPRSEGDEG